MANVTLTQPIDDFLKDDLVVVFEGDSITNGYGLSSPSTERVSKLCESLPQFSGATIYNTAVDGSLVATLAARYVASVQPYAPATGTTGYLFVNVGLNDVAALTAAATIFAAIESYATTAIADGWKVIVSTIGPSSSFGTAQEAIRSELNSLIQQSQIFYAIIDLNQFLLSAKDTTWFQADGTHFTAATHKLWARLAGAARAGATWSEHQQAPKPQVAMVRLSADYTAPDTNYNTIPFDTVVFDPSSIFDAGSYKFIPNVPGYYRVDVSAEITGAGAIAIELLAFDGTNWGTAAVTSLPSSDTLKTSYFFYLASSTDYVKAFIKFASTGPVVEANINKTFMSIQRLK